MKIKPLCEMYNTHYRIYCNPGVPVDVPDELAREYITAGAAVSVGDQGRDVEPVEEQPEEQPEEPKKPRGRAKKER